MGSNQFVVCVANNDANALVKLPGVGRKTAERLLIEMRDRLKDWKLPAAMPGKAPVAAESGSRAALREAESALISLGYKPQEAARAVSSAIAALEADELEPATEQIIRTALKQLGKV
jgi:Holliday junction DNA helicase RuvA